MTGEFILRLFVAAILGSVVGLDREYRAKEAGYRTHFLVSLGSALMMIISQYGFIDVVSGHLDQIRYDPGRVAAQVVTGIGFIGAGTIILQRHIVRGLTTAAGIWATSGIGLAIGAGMYWLGLAATVLTLIGLEVMGFFFKSVSMKSSLVEFSTTKKETLSALTKLFNSKDYVVVSYQVEEKNTIDGILYIVSLIIKSKRNNKDGHIMELLQNFEDVMVTRIE